MVINPDTNLRLIKCPLELNQNQQIDFVNQAAQYAYFNSLPKRSFDPDNFTYVRKDSVLRLPVLVDDIYDYNYVMYQNEAFGDKWFYAAINRLEFISPNCTYAYIETDVWQTWMFNLKMKQCFVEREHVTDDTIGIHTVAENVELGQIVNNGTPINLSVVDPTNGYLAVGVTELIDMYGDTGQKNWLRVYGGIYSGLTYAFFDSFVDLSYFIRSYDIAGKTDAIQTIFYVGRDFVQNSHPTVMTYGQAPYLIHVTWIEPSDGALTLHYTINKPASLNGYTPKNNKLLTYPYCYLTVCNNAGIDVPFHYDLFRGNPRFSMSQVLTPSMSSCIIPENYRDGDIDSEYCQAIPGPKTPQCSWTSDIYTNWLTQNATNIAVDSMNASLSAGLNVASGNVIGGATNLLNSVTNSLTRAQQMSFVPNQIKGNVNSGDVHYSNRKCCFTITHRCIRREFAKIIDGYFSMFGYKVNTVKVPQWRSRPTWNYIKTQNCTFECDCPQDDAVKIQALFNNGFTVWHVPSQFGNYDFNNK